jgi:FHS family L-fucose permease-like MFS transporter
MLVTDKKYLGGVVSQMFYVGAQIMCWTYIYHYAEVRGISAEVAGSYQLAAFIVFFIARFLFTYLMKYISAAKLLLSLSLTAIILVLIVIFSKGMLGLYALVGVSFALSLMFPTIYGIALEGMPEEEAKVGAAGLVMAIVGGALMPTIQGSILDLGGPGLEDISFLGYHEINLSFILPLFSFMIISFYARRVLKRAA